MLKSDANNLSYVKIGIMRKPAWALLRNHVKNDVVINPQHSERML